MLENGNGGTNQIRTGDKGFADLGLTTWRWCHSYEQANYTILYEKLQQKFNNFLFLFLQPHNTPTKIQCCFCYFSNNKNELLN